MLRVRNCKLVLLAALLIGAAGSIAAQSYGTGFFSVSATEQVQFADENLKVGETEYFQWSELSTQVPFGQRVLTQTEWAYLFQTRDHAYELYALAQVDGVNGLVILPDYDTWTLPPGLSFNYYATGDGYGKNVYNATQWAQMEAAGAVFLPCRGYSADGTTRTDETTHGTYWTSTEYATGNPYYIQFDDTYFYAEKHNSSAGVVYRSVRTVKAAPAILNENDEQPVFETKKESLQSGSEAYIIRTLRKAGCFNTLCLPFNVPNIEESPLAGAEVYTFTSATVQDGTLQLDIAPLTGSALTAGTPYLIQWDNTGEVLNHMHFTNITWDDDAEASPAGTGEVRYIGFYGKTHIADETDGEQHLNLFLGANNELYWPTDGNDDSAKMLGFRAYFQITQSGAASSPIRRGMPATLRIRNTATGNLTPTLSQGEGEKILRDGQLYLIFNGAMYDVRGQKIKEGGMQ